MAKQNSAATVQLSPSERETLQGLTRRRKTASGMAQRAAIVLCAAQGESNAAIARKLGVHRDTVIRWRTRFSTRRLDGLFDEPRPGAPRKILDKDVERVVTMTLERPKASTHWSTRMMAKQSGLSQTSISRIWRAFGLKPHRQDTFKISTDPLFVDKVRDIVGLYMNPPDRAVVLCVDEKSQMQALDRTQPLLPMGPGRVERRTHDYVRHGTTTLFAALDVKAGEVIGACYRRHRAKEFRRFLEEIDRNAPQQLEVHLVLDNASTHKTPAIKRWLLKHPRYHLHFTPTSSSWMNQVERWFAELTQKALRRGVHRSVGALERAVLAYEVAGHRVLVLELQLAVSELGANTPVADIAGERAGAFFAYERVTKTRGRRPKSQLSMDKTRSVLKQALQRAHAARLVAAVPLPVAVAAA